MHNFDTSRLLEIENFNHNELPVNGEAVNYHFKVIKKIDMNKPNKEILSKLHGDDLRIQSSKSYKMQNSGSNYGYSRFQAVATIPLREKSVF